MSELDLSCRNPARTIPCLLREQMDSVDSVAVRRRNLKERLGFKRMGCCGVNWGCRPETISDSHEDEDDDQNPVDALNPGQPPIVLDTEYTPTPSTPLGMNLAAALAAERQLRSSDGGNSNRVATTSDMPGTPLRVSLMRLLDETDGVEGENVTVVRETERGGGGGGMGSDMVCCVCMEREKGAAFIPCGHTYCRVCSRELWLNRGACTLCNSLILEILDIF